MAPRTGSWLRLMLVAALVWLTPAARAQEATEQDYSTALCERAIFNGARRGGVPPEVLYAVALTETGRKSGGRLKPWPWAINREGEGFWFESREEALEFGRQSLAAGRKSFDVGCVQINYRWHGQAFPSIEDMFDPEFTATYAAQFLANLYAERGSWSEAAGAYHSLTPELSSKYRKRFDQMLTSLEGGVLSESETLLASASPETPQMSRGLSRQERREAQRAAAVERIRNAGPPPEPVMGSVAAVQIPREGAGLLVQGTPMLSQAQPLLSAAGGSLF